MKKQKGYVDEFRRQGINEKLRFIISERNNKGELSQHQFFFEEDEKETQTKYIRKRQQPDFQDHNDKQLQETAVKENELFRESIQLNQEKNISNYKELEKEVNTKREDLKKFAEGLFGTALVQRGFQFKSKTYVAPPRKKLSPKRTEQETKKKDEDDKKINTRKIIGGEQKKYDFFKINQEKQRDRAGPGKKAVRQPEDDLLLPDKLQDIAKMNDFDQLIQTFNYSIQPDIFERQLDNLYTYGLVQNSLKNFGSQNYNINYFRDLGLINRRPSDDLLYFTPSQLKMEMGRLEYYETLNIATCRLTSSNLPLCLKNKRITHKMYEDALSQLKNLKTLRKTFTEAKVGDDTPMKMEDESDQQQIPETPRIVTQIQKLRLEMTKQPQTSGIILQFQDRIHWLLDRLFKKIVESSGLDEPTLAQVRDNVAKIKGLTDSGFDRKKLLWMYCETLNTFKNVDPEQNIRNLVQKNYKQQNTVVSKYRDVPGGQKLVERKNQMKMVPLQRASQLPQNMIPTKDTTPKKKLENTSPAKRWR